MKMCASVWFSKGVATRRLFLWRTGISFVALSTQPFVVLGAHVGDENEADGRIVNMITPARSSCVVSSIELISI